MSHPRAKVFFSLYLCAIVYLSLYPGNFQLFPKTSRLFWVPLLRRREILDFILNVLFYVPLGASAYLAMRRTAYSWPIAVAVGGSLSWTIEWLQLWLPSRFGNLTDLASNTLGTMLGATVGYAAVRWQLLRAPAETSRWRLPASSSLLLATWLLWQTFPFIPAISLPRLLRLLEQLGPWSWINFAETLLGFAVLRAAFGASPWLWVAYAALPTQAFLLDRSLSLPALCGAAAGWIAAKLAVSRGRLWLAIILPAWLVIQELRPFSIGESRPFSWAPFQSWYEVSALGYYPTIFGKLFLYLSVIWSLRQRDLGWIRAIGIPAVILAFGEWAQQYLVGRTPESTDLLLLAAAAVLLKLCQFGVQNK